MEGGRENKEERKKTAVKALRDLVVQRQGARGWRWGCAVWRVCGGSLLID